MPSVPLRHTPSRHAPLLQQRRLQPRVTPSQASVPHELVPLAPSSTALPPSTPLHILRHNRAPLLLQPLQHHQRERRLATLQRMSSAAAAPCGGGPYVFMNRYNCYLSELAPLALLKNVGQEPKKKRESKRQHEEKAERPHQKIPEEVAPGAEIAEKLLQFVGRQRAGGGVEGYGTGGRI
jgi:hypothetical protein